MLNTYSHTIQSFNAEYIQLSWYKLYHHWWLRQVHNGSIYMTTYSKSFFLVMPTTVVAQWFQPLILIFRHIIRDAEAYPGSSRYMEGVTLQGQAIQCVPCSMVKFLQNHHNRHPIAHPWGWDMWCLLWFKIWFTFCHFYCSAVCNIVIVDRVITALDCILASTYTIQIFNAEYIK